jgi:multiple sugar transport system substrate-binding protein
VATPEGSPSAASGTGVKRRSRRDFLRKAFAVSGAALLVAGAADLGLYGLQLDPNAKYRNYLTSTTNLSVTSQGGLLPDYLDFLEWMKSVSDKVPSKTADLTLEQEFAPYALQARDPDFLRYGSVNTGYSELPYLVQLEAVQLAVSTKSAAYDVYSIDNQNIASFGSGVISPNELGQTYPDLTYPKYNIQDFMPTVWDYVATYPPNTAHATGGNSTTNFTLFPLDIYDKLGFSPPATWDEYFQQAQKLPGNGTPYASASMANADVSIIYEYLSHLASFGGSIWEISGNSLTPALNSDKCLAALENYVRFSKYADPGSHNFTWTDVFVSLSTGASATALIWHDYYNWLNDPSRSPIAAGKFVPAMNPAGPVGSFSTYGGAGLGVSRFSRRPQAAYLWIQWATCKGLQEMTLIDKYHIFPTRTSVFDVPEVQSQINSGTLAALSVAKKAWASGTTALTPFPKWLQVLVPLSTHINNAWTGAETPKQALNSAQSYIESNFPNLTF